MTLITILYAYGRLNDERALSNIKAAAAAQTQSLLFFLDLTAPFSDRFDHRNNM